MKNLLLFAVLVSLPLPLHGADLSDLIYTTNDRKVTITDCDRGASGKLVIPNTIEGNPVTSIGNRTFEDCNNLTSITIGDNVTSIGRNSFKDCINLKSITIPNGVTSIGGEAFYQCINLKSITIPDGVTSIGEYAFYQCINLTNIIIPNSVTSISEGILSQCTDLTSITIGDSVTSIGRSALNGCTSLTSFTIPNGVTNIENKTFKDCVNLKSITIPNGVTSIGGEAFYQCINLSAIKFLGNAPTLGSDVFKGVNTNVVEIRENATGFHQEFEDLKVITPFLLFEMREVLYNKTHDTFTLTWKSNSGKMYALYFSETLQEFDQDIDDSIFSGGNSTTYGPFVNPMPGARKLFFRAQEYEAEED